MREVLQIDETDYNREWLSLWKTIHFLKVMFLKSATDALSFAWKFSDIEFEALQKMWKKWIILDIDECIAPHHWKILPENIEIIKTLLKNDWEIIIYSNMKKSDRYKELEKLWIKVVTSQYSKPDSRWFNECLYWLWLPKHEVIMIWDNFLTDWGSIWAWIDFIKVKPIKTGKRWRIFQKTFRSIADILADKRHNNF